ncbi:MAG: rod shape-determining protein RodA [Kyrpidia tusciae]|nr:rod shape-determining protein RodA [Kyrpidia tusciae]MBE3551573.1 rod shape-determining protein RodA [Kyrpidia tusciae]
MTPGTWLKRFDWMIVAVLVAIACISVINIASATHTLDAHHPSYYYTRQIIWFGIGFLFMGMVVAIGDQRLAEWWKPMYWIGIVLLVAVYLFGTEINGAKAWFDLKVLSVQPSEYMKLATIVALSQYFAKLEESGQRRFRDLFVPMGMIGLPFILIVIEPDLGMGMVMLAMGIGMFMVSGTRWRHLLVLFGAGAAMIASLVVLYHVDPHVFFKIIKPYQLDRLMAFRDPVKYLKPDETGNAPGYHTYESLIAVGSGGLWGEGFQQGAQTQGRFVPENYTDFIFSVLSEEWGFVGSMTLILLYLIFFYRMILIALGTRDMYGTNLIAGVFSMFFAQVFENIGMNIGIMPITGITLPFMSYGGSSIATSMMAVGLVLSVGLRRKKTMF